MTKDPLTYTLKQRRISPALLAYAWIRSDGKRVSPEFALEEAAEKYRREQKVMLPASEHPGGELPV